MLNGDMAGMCHLWDMRSTQDSMLLSSPFAGGRGRPPPSRLWGEGDVGDVLTVAAEVGVLA